MSDIAIVGGGLSGAALAIHLLRAPGRRSIAIPGSLTRARNLPSVGSKFGSVRIFFPPISISSVACPMYVMRIS